MKSKKYAIYIKKSFCNDKNKKKVRDHCHYTGKNLEELLIVDAN